MQHRITAALKVTTRKHVPPFSVRFCFINHLRQLTFQITFVFFRLEFVVGKLCFVSLTLWPWKWAFKQ